jgi:uncharacterized lipoprotein YehR (DUF1307 family)
MKKYVMLALLSSLIACTNKEATPKASGDTNVVEEKSFGQKLKEKVVKQATETVVDKAVDKVAEKAKDEAKDKLLKVLLP